MVEISKSKDSRGPSAALANTLIRPPGRTARWTSSRIRAVTTVSTAPSTPCVVETGQRGADAAPRGVGGHPDA